MGSIEKSSEVISGAIYDWLAAEVATSGESRNKYMDNYYEMRQRIALGYGHALNWSSAKEISHLNRLPKWFEAYKESLSDDSPSEFLSAQLLFSPLMFLSGSHRAESIIETNTPYEYSQRRALVAGVDIEDVVQERLRATLPKGGNFAAADIDIDKLEIRMRLALKVGEKAMKSALARLALGFDMGKPYSRTVENLHIHQHSWAGFAADCVALAAKLRIGELEAVPFLEPVSITDQSGKVHYPLRQPVDWLAVLNSGSSQENA